MNGRFSSYHPVVQFSFFFSVMLMTMFIMHPVYLVISFTASLMYMIYLMRGNSVKLMAGFIVPMLLFISIINPLFSHGGVTVLFYLPDGNQFTLESVVYGIVSGTMFSCIMLWCVCMRRIMTTDRVIYLFGRLFPGISLLLSMILRFIPEMSQHFREIRNAQRCIGRDITDGGFIVRIRNLARMISALIQRMLEGSVDTADSLKSKGYGLPHRTSFSIFRFSITDGIMLAWILAADSAVLAAFFSGITEFDYFPMISSTGFNLNETAVYGVYLFLCMTPMISGIREGIYWNALRSAD